MTLMSRSAAADEKTNRRLVLGMLAGPVIWGLYFSVGYLIAEASCEIGLLETNVGGFNLVVVVVVGLGAVAAAITAWLALWSHRRWRASGSEPDNTETLQPFLARASMLLNLLFLLATITTALGTLFIIPCRWT